MSPFHILLLFLGALISMTEASSAPLFCKCTCFKNSTLIQLNAQASCAQCTHAFCLSQNLPICKDISSSSSSDSGSSSSDSDGSGGGGSSGNTGEVLSTCIQRDSRKDEIIVWAFILGTTGLLGWAAAKKVKETRAGGAGAGAALGAGGTRGRDRGEYAAVSGRG